MKKIANENEISGKIDVLTDKVGTLAITIETVNKNMKDGFATVMEHIVDVREIVNGHDQRFDSHDQRFDSLEMGMKESKNGQQRLQDSIWEIKTELKEIKERLARVNKRTLEDDDALVFEFINLKKRVSVLENELKKLVH